MSNEELDYYQAPKAPPSEEWAGSPSATPGVWPWYITYCVLMAFMYLAATLLMGFGSVAILADRGDADDKTFATIFMAIFAVVCLGLLALYAAGPLLPKRPWAWVYGIVLISLGMTSICT